MTPTLAEILHGNFLSLATPATPDMAGEFMATRIGAIALMNALAAQEAERGSGTAVVENRAIAAVLIDASNYAIKLPATDDDPSPAAIDARNAALRRALIDLHEAAEARNDTATEDRILDLYCTMAAGRILRFPGT